MRTLRQLCAAVVLTLTLAASTAAGTMYPGVVSPPPPPPDSMTEEQTAQADGTMHTGVAEAEPETDNVTGIALSLLQNVLSLF